MPNDEPSSSKKVKAAKPAGKGSGFLPRALGASDLTPYMRERLAELEADGVIASSNELAPDIAEAGREADATEPPEKL